MSNLKEGDLVYCWDGDKRPEKPFIGHFIGKNYGTWFVKTYGQELRIPFNHIEPVCKCEPEGWTDDFGNEIKSGDIVEVWDEGENPLARFTFLRKDEHGYVTQSCSTRLPLYWRHARKAKT